jgi:hypothetical protein
MLRIPLHPLPLAAALLLPVPLGACASSAETPGPGGGAAGQSGGTPGAGRGGSGGTTGGAGRVGTSGRDGGGNAGRGDAGSSASGTGAGAASGGASAGGASGANSGGAGTGPGGGGGGGGGGAGAPATGPLQLLTDTNRDGAIDAADAANFTAWTWTDDGGFFLANVDDDDEDGESDAADEEVNGVVDEVDLAGLVIRLDQATLSRAERVGVSVTAGTRQTRLFEEQGSNWTLVSGELGTIAAQMRLGIEATEFADAGWDGFAVIEVEVSDGAGAFASESVKMRVAPWLMLPSSAATEQVFVTGDSVGTTMRGEIDAVLTALGLPACFTPTPDGQDQWYQDTMEIGYTQLPGFDPMHVVMTAQRGSGMDGVASMLLTRDFGYISIGSPRGLGGGFGGDYWMDWMGNLEVTHPLPGHPFGRIYYGRSEATTFHPTIVEFLEAQELQSPFSINTEWLVIQHVDEIMNWVVDQDGKPKMLVVSAAAANAVLNSGYDADQQAVQGYIDDCVETAKQELGITDADIVHLPLYFEGGGLDYSARWSDPVNSLFVNGTFVAGDAGTPAAIKADVETKLGALGIEVAWVDDANYQSGGGNVHCGSNATKAPPCGDLADCL